ncbi:MetQ/NlpA family ABC transporter substrate-binding protein [uncultured Sutterella sp.]|uniref:MetQ/NlpA family ABC transporter substrate-binding protein n=1 Tax=uncultured Sutterella sp. TaxID=286133 RepID=UPI0025E3A00E|nr:MetQ/NlpA family ABC transporter substrate-binding protein [uncultured Sutterella sp.]
MKITFAKSAAAVAAGILLSVTLAGCGGEEKSDVTVVKIGVVGEYNAQWDTVNQLLAKDKIKVELVKYSDYATPNRALSDKEIDLNSFQHKAYLANDIKRNGYKIVSIGDTLIAPLRVFNNKTKIKSIEEIKDGDKIAIPADLTNGGRALKLLEQVGLFTVNPDKGFVPNKTDITHFNKKVQIVEAESGMLANLLPDVTAAVINGGNAFTAKLDPYKDSIFSENVDPKTNPYVGQLVNIIVAREADKDNAVYKKVVAAYQTQETAQAIKDAYKGAFVPAWAGAQDYKLK